MSQLDFFGTTTAKAVPATGRPETPRHLTPPGAGGTYRMDHPDTSSDAAVQIKEDTARLRGRVLAALQSCPMSDQELQTVLGMDPNTERPRRVELVQRGLVRDSGRRTVTTSGRKAIVWEAS